VRPPLLEIERLTKRYGDFVAVDDVSLTIEPGEIFALLGPNGAGKTTLIGCTTGLKARFEGHIRVAGRDVRSDYRVTRRLVGVVPQELNFDAFFPLRQVLAFQAGYFGQAPDPARIDALLRDFSLTDKADANTRKLSGGMKRRMMICKALVHDPVLLFLDEPTAGVDVELREELWSYVRRLRERGTTIVLTTHYIEEAEKLADRIGFLRNGQLLRVDDRDTLLGAASQREVQITLTHPRAIDLAAAVDIPGLSAPTASTLRLTGATDDPAPLNALLAALVQRSISVSGIDSRQQSLEDIFRHIMQEGA
jgi:ABC-2 type transport system ATP-binding protein